MIRKHEIGLFIKTAETSSTETFKRIKKSTALTLAMNVETEEQDYIADENPTTEIKQYKPQIEQPLKMIKDEPDFEYFWEKFYNMATGESAKTEAIVAFVFDKTTVSSTDYYKAWRVNSSIEFSELNAVDSELKFNLNFAGTVSKGWVTLDSTTHEPTWVATLPTGNGSPVED